MADEKFDKKITKEDIDFGSLDDELDQDLEKFDVALDEPKPKQRKPITDFTLATARGIMLPSEEILKTVEDEIVKRMPETGKVLSDVKTIASSIDMYKTQFMTEITPALNRLRSVGRRLFEKVEKYVPTKIKSKVESILQTPEEARQESLEASRNEFIQQQITNLTKIQAEALEKQQISEEVTNFINQQIESYRHKDVTTLLAHITQATKGSYAFLQTTLRTYIVKSLSLKYKSLFHLQDLVSLVRNILTILDTKLEEIKHNTALPDIVKSTKSEELKYYLHQKLYGRISEKLSDFTKNFTQRLIENVKTNIFDKLKEKILETAEAAGTVGEMSAGMAEEAEEYGMSKPALAGEFAGSSIQKYLLSKLFKYLEKKHIDIAKIQNLDDLIKKLYTTTIFGAGTWLKESDNKVLQWLGKNIIPSIQREHGEIENVLESNLTEPALFDVMTHKAIVEVIPGYLSLIHSEISGIGKTLGAKPSEKIIYDVKTESFTTEKTLKDRIKHELLGTEQSRIEKFKPLVKYIIERYLAKDGNKEYFYQHLDDVIKFAVNVAKHTEPIRFSIIKKLKEGDDLTESELTSSGYMLKDVKNPDALIDILYTTFVKQPENTEEIIAAYNEEESLEPSTFGEKLKSKLSQIKQNLKDKYKSTKETFGDIGSIAEFNQIAQSVAIELDEQLIDTLNKVKQLGQQSLLTEFLQTKTPEQIEAYKQKLIKKYQEENIKKLKKKYKTEEEIPKYLLDKAKELTTQQKSELQSKIAEFASKTGLSHDIIREKLRDFNKEELIKDIEGLYEIHQKLKEKSGEISPVSSFKQKVASVELPQHPTILDKIKIILEETLYPIKSNIIIMKDLLSAFISQTTKEKENIESGKGGTGLIKDEPQISGPGFYIQKAEKELHIPLESKEDKEAFLSALMSSLSSMKSDKVDKSKLTSMVESIKTSLFHHTSNLFEKHQILKQLEKSIKEKDYTKAKELITTKASETKSEMSKQLHEKYNQLVESFKEKEIVKVLDQATEAIKQGDYAKAKELIKSYTILTKESVKGQFQNQIDKSPIATKIVNTIKSFISTPAKWIKNIWGLEYKLLKSIFSKPFSWTKTFFTKAKNWFTDKPVPESFIPIKQPKNFQQPTISQQLAETSAKTNVEQLDFLSQIITYLQSINEAIPTIGNEITERLDQMLLALQSNLPKETRERLLKLPKIQPKGLLQKLKNIVTTPFTFIKKNSLLGLQTIKEFGSKFLTKTQKYLIDLPKSIITKPLNLLSTGAKGLGNLTSKVYSKVKDLVSKITKHKDVAINKAISMLNRTISLPFNMLDKFTSIGQNVLSTIKTKYEQLKYPDIYVKNEVKPGYPKVPGEWIRIGRARLANGQPITDVTKINQPIIDMVTAQTLITKEDLEKGLVDIQNRPLVKLTERIKKKLEPLTELTKGAFSLGVKTTSFVFDSGTKLLSTGASAISTVFNKIAEKLHLPKLPVFTTGISKKLDTIISLIQPISDYFKTKLPELREGSYQDYLKDEEKEEKTEKVKEEISYLKQIAQNLKSPTIASAKASLFSRIAQRFRTNKKAKEKSGEEDSFFGDLLKFELGKKALGYIKKSRIGQIGTKVLRWGKGLIKLPFGILRGAGRLGLGVGRLALTGLGGLASVTGTVGSALLSPWVAAPILVAGTGYAGYRLWKSHAKKNKINRAINTLFFKYYGTTNVDAIEKLSKLSYNKLLKNEGFTREEFQAIAQEFGLDSNDEQQMRYFATWYHNRFLPVFLKMASIMKSQFGRNWNEYIDLDPKTELPLFVQLLHKSVSELLTPEILKLKPDIKSYLQFIGKKSEPHAELLKPAKPLKEQSLQQISLNQKQANKVNSITSSKSFTNKLKNIASTIFTKTKSITKKFALALSTPFEHITHLFHKKPLTSLPIDNAKPSRSKQTIKQIVQTYYPYIQSAVSYVKNSIGIDIPPELIVGMIAQESSGNSNAISSAGTSGLMQLLPITAQYISKQIGIPSTQILTDPKTNILAGTYYLATLYKQFKDWPKTLAAYNWGPANVKKYGLTEAPVETQKYIPETLGNAKLAKSIIDTKPTIPPISKTITHIAKSAQKLLSGSKAHATELQKPESNLIKPSLPVPTNQQSQLTTIPKIPTKLPQSSGEIKHITHATIEPKLDSILQESNNISTKQLEVLININDNIQKLIKTIENMNQLPSEQQNTTKLLEQFNENVIKLTEAISKMDVSKYFTDSKTTSQSKFTDTLIRQFSNRHIDLTKKKAIG